MSIGLTAKGSGGPTYVLVHGAGQGSWCWVRVRKGLQAAGHQVFTPTLTGLSDRSHLLTREVNLSTHITDVVNLIRWEDLANVVLCGHSYSGSVISGVADQIPNRIRALVYLDAFVLEDGECVLDVLPAEEASNLRRKAQTAGDGWKVPPFPASFFDVSERDAAWIDAKSTPHPLACLEERIRFTGGLGQIQDAVHVLATGWNNVHFPPSHERAKARGWKLRQMDCPHLIMLNRPGETTDLLLEYAASEETAGRSHR